MKSIMKSAFAIIAVALMIMVAVVPMVGVFTEDSSATNQYDPKAPATGDKITLTFNLFEGSTAITSPSSYTIQVTWNSGKNSALISCNENKFEKVFDETKMTGAKAVVGSVSNGVFTKDVDFAEYTIGNVAAGTSLTIDIVKGYKQSGDITFNTATTSTTVYGAVQDILASGDKIIVTYNLYKDVAATKSMTKGEKVATLDTSSKFNVYYPASETDVYVKVTKITVGTKDFAFSNATAVQVAGSTASSSLIVTADQSVFTVSGVVGLPAGQINSLQVLDSDGKSVISNWNTIDATISSANGDKATFMYTLNSGATASKFTFTLWFSSSVSTTGLELTTSGNVPLTNALFGTYKMGEVSAADGANLKFNLVASEKVEATTTAYVAGGYYYANVPTKTSVTGTIVPVSTDYEIETTSATAGSTTAVVAKASGTIGTGTSAKTYALAPVSGKVTNVSDGYTFTLNGATKTFGLVGKNVVCKADSSDMKFAFYVDVGAYISFTAASGNSFDAASSGKYYVPTAGISNMQLTLKDKLMTFSFTDGDGKALTGGTLAINVIDANNATVTTTAVSTPTIAGTNQIKLNDASLDTSKLKVWFSWTASVSNGVANTFTASSKTTAIAYKETSGVMAVSSLETTYSLYVKDVNGKAIASPTITGAVVSAYVAEDGTKIYKPLSPTVTVTATLDSVGAYEFRVVKDLVNVTLSGTPANVVIFNVSKAGYYFETVPYLAKVGTDGTMTITAKTDGFTATIYKNDGVTPIANTQFKLSYTTSGSGDSTTTVYDVATTDANGKITFLSDEKINDSAVITPVVATGLGTIKNAYGGTSVAYDGVFYGKFLATNNIYTVDITDADGKALAKPTGTLTFSGTGVTTVTATITNYVITVSSDAKAGDVLSVAFTTTNTSNATIAVRTFDDYTLTADDVKNGTISLVSNESTYTVSATDADGKALKLNDASTAVKKKVNGGTPADITESQSVVYKATANSLKTKITYVITAPADNEVYVADIVGNNTAYGLTTGIYYAFDGKNVAVAESVMSTITFELVDAVGASTLGGLANSSFVITDSTGVANSTWSWISGTTKWSMIGDKDETYYVKTTPNAGSKYTFADQYIVDGKIKAKEQTVVFTAVDAAGLPINATFNMYKVASDGAIDDTDTTMAFDQNGQNSIIMALSSTTTYKLVDSTGKYTFTTDGTKFTSAEQTVYFKFAYANGFNYPSGSVASVTVYYKDGTSYSATVGASVTLDTTNVASYVVGYTVSGSMVYFSGTTSELKCSLSKITGFAIKDSTYSLTATYLNGSTIVDTATATIGNNGKYEITPDFVNGGYDKVLVQCFDASGYLYSQATLDAKTGYVADLVPVKETAESLAAKIITNTGIAYDVAGGKVYLTAIDKISKFSDDGNYVETYKFAGWYVNGAKFTDDLNCAVDNVNTNVITASYVLDDSKELGKESASGISPTVLVIGIAAVIIALIAVVYAVIQKKE